MTAYVLLGLGDARDLGIDVPDDAFERALDCLSRCGNDDGTYEYALTHANEQAGRKLTPSGSAGRGPLCTSTLHRYGRADADAMAGTLDRFMQHRAVYGRQQGRTLMHCGAEGEGSHYLMFDYAFAAAALAELPESPPARWRVPLLDLILAARTDAGSFVDNPILGDHVGTALALEAFHALCERP